MEIMDRLCELNGMERTTFMQFAIMGMLDYMAELRLLPESADGELPKKMGGSEIGGF